MDKVQDSFETNLTNKVIAGRYVLESLLSVTALATFFCARDQMTLEVDGTKSPLILACVSPQLIQLPSFESTLLQVLEKFYRPDSPLNITDFHRETNNFWLIYNENSGNVISGLVTDKGREGLSLQETQTILFNIFRVTRQYLSKGGFGFLEPGAILCNGNACKLLNAPLVAVLRILSGLTNPLGGKQLALCSAFISPEVARGMQPSSRDDTFSLAVIAYYLLSGNLPYDNKVDSDKMDVKQTPPVALIQLGGSGWKAMLDGLSLQPGQRQASPYDLLQGIVGANTYEEIHAPTVTFSVKRKILAKAAALVGVGILTAYGSYHIYQGSADNIEVIAKIESQLPQSTQTIEPLTQVEIPDSLLLPVISGTEVEKSPNATTSLLTGKQLPESQEEQSFIDKEDIADTEPVFDEQKASEKQAAPTDEVFAEKATSSVKPAVKENSDEKVASKKQNSLESSNLQSASREKKPSAAKKRHTTTTPPLSTQAANQIQTIQQPASRPSPPARNVVAINPNTFIVVDPVSSTFHAPLKRVTKLGNNTFVVAAD